MERVDVILGHIGQYRELMSRLPILVLECSKGRCRERVEIRLFGRIKVDDID